MGRPDPLDALALIRPATVARLYDVSVRCLKSRLAKGTWYRAMPCSRDPLRWRRADVERDLKTASYAADLARELRS